MDMTRDCSQVSSDVVSLEASYEGGISQLNNACQPTAKKNGDIKLTLTLENMFK